VRLEGFGRKEVSKKKDRNKELNRERNEKERKNSYANKIGVHKAAK
jgi:hypothetical protein